ncbi:MAG TPA: hypothetical protein VGN81_16270 [Pseudonocardiaceae bacterium]
MTQPEQTEQRPDRIGTEDLVDGVRDERDERDVRDDQQSGDTVHSRQSDRQDDVALLEDSDSERFRGRWHDVQAAFVDDPRNAVQDADQLVAELMQTLAATFAERKRSLEEQWHGGGEAQTEDLRLALRSYRSFFDQLLAH